MFHRGDRQHPRRRGGDASSSSARTSSSPARNPLHDKEVLRALIIESIEEATQAANARNNSAPRASLQAPLPVAASSSSSSSSSFSSSSSKHHRRSSRRGSMSAAIGAEESKTARVALRFGDLIYLEQTEGNVAGGIVTADPDLAQQYTPSKVTAPYRPCAPLERVATARE